MGLAHQHCTSVDSFQTLHLEFGMKCQHCTEVGKVVKYINKKKSKDSDFEFFLPMSCFGCAIVNLFCI